MLNSNTYKFNQIFLSQQAKEHYEPWEVSGEKEYATPYLEGDVYLFQKLWKEKEHMKAEIESYDKEWAEMKTDPNTGIEEKRDYALFQRSFRRTYNRLDHLPKTFKPNGSETSDS